MPLIRLTQNQRNALEHRLTVPDALAESLSDAGTFNPGDIITVADLLLKALPAEAGTLDTLAADAVNVSVTECVLVDCVEGSTWVGCAPEDKRYEAYRTIESLALRIRSAYRRTTPINVPNY